MVRRESCSTGQFGGVCGRLVEATSELGYVDRKIGLLYNQWPVSRMLMGFEAVAMQFDPSGFCYNDHFFPSRCIVFLMSIHMTFSSFDGPS